MRTRRLGAGWYLAERPYWRGYIDYLPMPGVGKLRWWMLSTVEWNRRLMGRIPYGPTRHPGPWTDTRT